MSVEKEALAKGRLVGSSNQRKGHLLPLVQVEHVTDRQAQLVKEWLLFIQCFAQSVFCLQIIVVIMHVRRLESNEDEDVGDQVLQLLRSHSAIANEGTTPGDEVEVELDIGALSAEAQQYHQIPARLFDFTILW